MCCARLGGNDTYIVRNTATTIIESASEGDNDKAAASTSFALGAGVAVEQLSTTSSVGTAAINLTGNALSQTIIGNAGNNVLRSGKGLPDTMIGLGGNDIYRVSQCRAISSLRQLVWARTG